MKSIELSGLSRVAARYYIWQLLALGVGTIFLVIALGAGRPWSPAGIVGMLIVALTLTSLALEWRAGRGWRLQADGASLILIKPDRTQLKVSIAELRAAQRVVREVQELDFPRWRRGAQHSMAATPKTQLQTFLLLQPEAGAHWGRRKELSDIVDARGLAIPMADHLSDARLMKFFADLGVSYSGK